jgi:pimeloyl-ACP methyl ester carboxylesterase
MEQPFEVPIEGGVLVGARSGNGAPALLLHGGAAVPDYLGDLAELLDGRFESIRYTQRGTPPSSGDPPYTIETHVEDAVRVLDHCELDRAWAIGHSWGGHLALHLALSHPERLLGLLLVCPLGADSSIFEEFDENMRRGATDKQRARVDKIEQRRREGIVTEEELVERFALAWPHFFLRPEDISPPPERIGVQASIQTNASISEHFGRETLATNLPNVTVPALFVHGEQDPLPLRSTSFTAALMPNGQVETIPDCAHFPWIEQPDAFRAAVQTLLARVPA